MTITVAIDKQSRQYITAKSAIKKNAYECFSCRQDVFVKKGAKKSHHFAHYQDGCSCKVYTEPSQDQIHNRAQTVVKHILDSRIPINISHRCMKCEEDRETLICEKREFETHLEYRFDYNGPKVADVAQTVGGKIINIFEIYNTHKTAPGRRPEPWFEFDASQVIAAFNEFDGSEIQLECTRETCENCHEVASPAGVIYFNQRGAGCGKTYESIQLIQSDPRFTDTNTYIYLTKMHSAKDVIYNELKDQTDRGQLSSLELLTDDNSGKQYVIRYHNNTLDKDIMILIGTIDSFTYSVVDRCEIVQSMSYFDGIVKAIIQGHTSVSASGKAKYAGERYRLAKECLIVIDEAQDLPDDYFKAFAKLGVLTSIDVYVIGDKLQSIMSEHNIHTYVGGNDLGDRVVRSTGINKVMRFHNVQFVGLVNGLIKFDKYGLPAITEICDGNCRYVHEDHIKPYEIFSIGRIKGDSTDFVINARIDLIICRMEAEIAKYNYLPENFMFIFPIMKSNILASILEARIQEFWIHKFSDEEYRRRIEADETDKSRNYWKGHLGNEFHKYIYWHRSVEGKPINLKESEHASRILSIHASKGNGCEVVFLLGMTEQALTLMSKKPGNLIYESLLHVAVTRQKKSLYIGIDEGCRDDIYNRCKPFGIKIDPDKMPGIQHVSFFTKSRCLSDYLMKHDDIFAEINAAIIVPGGYARMIPKSDQKAMIDWGHHELRHAVMVYVFIRNIYNSCASGGSKDQIITILRTLSGYEIKSFRYKKYVEALVKIRKDAGNARLAHHLVKTEKEGTGKEGTGKEGTWKKVTGVDPPIIPLLEFEGTETSIYSKYTKTLKKIIKNIQAKLRQGLPKKVLPRMCPLECIVLMFMIAVTQKGLSSDISIMDIYSIMYCYDNCSNEIRTVSHKNRYKCLCKDRFKGGDPNDRSSYAEIRKSITHHYDNIEKMGKIYANYAEYVAGSLGCESLTYHMNHRITIGNKDTFVISDSPELIAYSETHVVCFIIRPQFTTLNFAEIMVASVLQTFMLSNCPPKHPNYKRYNGKKVMMCIITLDSDAPIFYEIHIQDHIPLIARIIRSWLIEQYSEHHDLLYRFYEYCRDRKPKDKSSVRYTVNQLETLRSPRMPLYIANFFSGIADKVDAHKKDISQIRAAMLPLADAASCASELKLLLDMSISKFLGQSDPDDSDSDVDY